MKHVPISEICPLCNVCEETTLHCLVYCSFAQGCLEGIGVANNTDNPTTFAGWLEMIMGQHTNSMIPKIAMLLWSVWKARNMVIWQDTYQHVDEVLRTARSTLDQWIEAQAKNFVPSIGNLHTMDGKELWTKPSQQTIKINLDAALFDSDNMVGYGLCARDHTGRLIDARAVCQRGRTSAVLAEALAFKEALSWIKSKQWHNVLIETDCLKVVQALRSSLTFTSPLGLVIADCKQLMQGIANAAFCFIKRSANRVAHCLARQSIFLSDRSFTEANAPSEVMYLCMSDLLNE